METVKYPLAATAGFSVLAAKTRDGQKKDWSYVVPAEEVEAHLLNHKCEPIGDTPQKLINDLAANLAYGDDPLPAGLVSRIEALCTK